MKPTHFTQAEGGYWWPWITGKGTDGTITYGAGDKAVTVTGDLGIVYNSVHSIKFDDGRVWDEINGFRETGVTVHAA